MRIREVFDKFLKVQKESLRPRTYSDYESVINLFAHCLQSYAWNYLPKEEYDKYEEYKKAGKEFADVYCHEEIAHNIDEFLGYFMPRKVLAGDEFIKSRQNTPCCARR